MVHRVGMPMWRESTFVFALLTAVVATAFLLSLHVLRRRAYRSTNGLRHPKRLARPLELRFQSCGCSQPSNSSTIVFCRRSRRCSTNPAD